jgi:hypothetical protein
VTHTRAEGTGEACPICHAVVADGEPDEWVPVCPLVYPDTEGLRCHETCLAEERERNRVLRREDLRPTRLGRRVAER